MTPEYWLDVKLLVQNPVIYTLTADPEHNDVTLSLVKSELLLKH
jgi:hypothetical protein